MTTLSTWLKVSAASLLLVSSLALAGDKVALITILDGPASVIQVATRLTAIEGAALESEAIIETSASTPFMRVEFDDGTALDLGPATRVLISPKWPESASGGASTAYVLEGWAKVTQGKSPSPGRSVLATLALDLSGMGRDAVVRVKGGRTEVFAESDEVTASVRFKGGKASPFKVARGQFMTRQGDTAPEITLRPHAEFIQSVPRAFRDTLPARASVFKGKKIAMAPAAPLTYADTQWWINAEPRVRTRFTARWKPLLQDATFRRELAGQMALHPEWGSLLSPEKASVQPAIATYPSAEPVKP